jgi:hypothetical protein
MDTVAIFNFEGTLSRMRFSERAVNFIINDVLSKEYQTANPQPVYIAPVTEDPAVTASDEYKTANPYPVYIAPESEDISVMKASEVAHAKQVEKWCAAWVTYVMDVSLTEHKSAVISWKATGAAYISDQLKRDSEYLPAVTAIADRDIPEENGVRVQYQLVEESVIPADETFRNAWVVSNGSVVTDMPRAAIMAHDMRRAARAKEFIPHDELISKQIPESGKTLQQTQTDAETARQAIRDKYGAMQVDIDAATDDVGLKSVLTAGGVV